MSGTKRSPKANLYVAYHEAGHAVACWRLGIGLRREGVTIARDETAGSAGSCVHRQVVGRDIEGDASDRNRSKAEKLAQICLAGDIAARRHNPRGVWRGADSDHRDAIDTLTFLTATRKELEAWLKLLHIRTEQMLSNPDVWRAVERLATELIQRQTISGKEATEIIRNGFDEACYSKHPEMRSQDLALAARLKAQRPIGGDYVKQ
jgi:hypothetical protein